MALSRQPPGDDHPPDDKNSIAQTQFGVNRKDLHFCRFFRLYRDLVCAIHVAGNHAFEELDMFYFAAAAAVLTLIGFYGMFDA